MDFKSEKIKVRFRDYSKTNIDRLLANLPSERQIFLINTYSICDDVHTKAEKINNWLMKLANKYFPIKTKIITQNTLSHPWITNDIRKCIDKKHKILSDYRNGSASFSYLSNYCKDLKYLLELAERNYHQEQLSLRRFDSKRKWKYINKISGRNTNSNVEIEHLDTDNGRIDDAEAVIEYSNSYFTRIPRIIHDDIEAPRNDYLHLVPYNAQSIFLTPSSIAEIINKASTLKNKNSLYDVPAKFLKLIIEHVADILTDLFNACIENSTYPNIFKVSKVVMLHKKGSKHVIDNYRPISILPTINKLFEKLLHDRFYSFLSSHSIISNDQYGFLPNRNTTLASLKFVNDILPSYNSMGNTTPALFIDFRKAFDTLDRPLLLKKLNRMGIRGTSNDLLKSYFDNRKQFVNDSSRNINSRTLPNEYGCVQGSNLGPLMFILYANDLHQLFAGDECVRVVTYADDTLIYIDLDRYADNNHIETKLTEILNRLLDWANFHKLAINFEKTKIMFFTNSNLNNRFAPNFAFSGKEIEIVKFFNYLGINLDMRLKYTDHVRTLK